MSRLVPLALLAAACTPSASLDSCRDDDCRALCRTAGLRSGACSDDGFCECADSADAGWPDVGDALPPGEVPTPDDGAWHADVPDASLDLPDADAPDTPPDAAPDVTEPEDAGEGDGAPTDVGWTPGGSGILCWRTSPSSCPDGEICDVPFCPPMFDGVCVTRPVSCPPGDHPVCGCNGLTYENECLRLAAYVAPKHDGRCVPGEDRPFCLEWGRPGMISVDWVDDPMDIHQIWCSAHCLGCTAECRDGGLPTEGWYAVCPSPPPWSSGGCEDDGLIHLADCL